MKIYSWSSVGYSADAQLVGEELEIIERNNEITPNHILEYAERHKDSELYKCFEWDDSEAGKKYRLQQARQIICSISLEIKEEPKKVQRVYVSIKDKDTEERIFKNIGEVLKNDDEYMQLIDKAKRELENCKKKYENLIDIKDLKEIVFDIYKNI